LTQIGITGRKISEVLDNEVIEDGGLVTIDLPVIECSLASEHETQKVQIGGYRSFINYNKHREQQHRKDKENKRLRSLKRQIKNIEGRSRYEDFPSSDMTISTYSGEKNR
jgi:hypothetical protein